MKFSLILLSLSWLSLAKTYTLVESYNGSNWSDSFKFHDEKDPTNGFVDYVAVGEAQSLGIARTVGTQVYLGVDNSTVLSPTGEGRKSTWVTSNKPFLHGLLIGDIAHMPGNICGTWPAFWTIREDHGAYGEIDIIEGFNNVDLAYTTMHTDTSKPGTCVFSPPADQETGLSNQGSTDCASDIGCSVQGQVGGYGTLFNQNKGGVYAMEWTSDLINIYFFPRDAIPADITNGTPNPANWGLPTANFESQYGNCDIDAKFLRQTIYFNIDFCGNEAGGQGWSDWSTCPGETGYSTCESYVAAHPEAFDESYWLINSVKVYQ